MAIPLIAGGSMAKLRSEEANRPSYLEILPGETSTVDGAAVQETWQEVRLALTSGSYNISGEHESLILCRDPKDEIGVLVGLFDDIISKKKDRVMFEPMEPSFEINVERTSYGALRVDAWIDAGNSATGFYIYDAVGIRFITDDDQLNRFKTQLIEEFGNVKTPEPAV